MPSLVRWIAAVVTLAAGLVLGAGSASADSAVSSNATTAHTVTSTPNGGVHPMDWWW